MPVTRYEIVCDAIFSWKQIKLSTRTVSFMHQRPSPFREQDYLLLFQNNTRNLTLLQSVSSNVYNVFDM